MDIQDQYNYEDGNECAFCEVVIESDKIYCSKECYTADNSERV